MKRTISSILVALLLTSSITYAEFLKESVEPRSLTGSGSLPVLGESGLGLGLGTASANGGNSAATGLGLGVGSGGLGSGLGLGLG